MGEQEREYDGSPRRAVARDNRLFLETPMSHEMLLLLLLTVDC